MKRMVETKAVELIEAMQKQGVTPEMILAPKMEDIVDADGHKRFQEWEGTRGIIPEGVTLTYNKATLSGSHLMFVIAGTVANGTQITNGNVFSYFDLPDWVMDKIVPVWQEHFLEVKTVRFFADDWTQQTMNNTLAKYSKMQVTASGDLTLTAYRSFRLQYDILID